MGLKVSLGSFALGLSWTPNSLYLTFKLNEPSQLVCAPAGCL